MMIQDIFPHRFVNAYQPSAKADADSYVFYFTEDGLLCSLQDNEISLPKLSDFETTDQKALADTSSNMPLTYLFSIDGAAYYLLQDVPEKAGEKKPFAPTQSEIQNHAAKAEKIELPAGFSFVTVRKLRDLEAGPKHLVFAAVTAQQLYHWYCNNRFCGRCGSKTVHDTKERAIRCPSCGNLVYPKIVPAVIVGVLHEDKILLTKYRTGFAHFALVAGFTEIGETLEETVSREVMEETGLRVRNIRYYKSQPWGIADDILAGFYCDAEGDASIRMDQNELKYAEWTSRDEVILQPDDFSLTNEMMERFKNGEKC